MTEKLIKRMKELPSTHLLGTGTPMCAGCGGLEALHEIYDILGENTVFTNAAGCMTLLSVYPFTPFRGSWLYTAMASAPAGAQGIRDALDILLEKKRIPPEDDLQVVTLTGDGSAYGMGLSATSGTIDRNLDYLYICYDNEGYGNTGQQYSEATPHAAKTSTSKGSAGFPGFKKDLFAIWAANEPAYVATVIRWISPRKFKKPRPSKARVSSWHWPPAPRAGTSIPNTATTSASWRWTPACGR
jgi:pyruvate ferredoxin oxidoreductase beta subunit